MNLSKINFKSSKVKYPLIFGFIAIAAFVLWLYQVYTPIQDELKDLESKKKAKQDTLNTILALKPQLKLLKEELRLSQIRLDSLKSIFPDQKEIPKLIREITAVARASGIVTTKFNPLPDIEKEYYIENKYNLTVEGGYHQLGEFFSFLANFRLIINLGSVAIAENPVKSADAALSEDLGIVLPSVISTFEMTTFSSKK